MLPAVLALAGCATTIDTSHTASTAPTSAAAPAQVNAASDALGAKMDNMLASRHPGGAAVTR